MPTWEETREHLRTKYKLLNDDPAWIGVGFGFIRSGRLQRVRIEPHAIGEIPGVRIWCDVLDASRVPEHIALARNMAFPIGALAIHEGIYVLVALLPLDGLVWSTFDTIIESLARDAASLREDAPAASDARHVLGF